jgi:hypothetical protein
MPGYLKGKHSAVACGHCEIGGWLIVNSTAI